MIKLNIEIVTPEKILCAKGGIERILLPLTTGDMEILPKHASYLANLKSGVITIWVSEKKKEYFAVHGGFVQVLKNKVKIVTQASEAKSDIDKMRALESKERAEKRLQGGKEIDKGRAQRALQRAMTRLLVLEKN